MNTSSTTAVPRYQGRPRPQQISGGLHGLTPAQVTASQRSRILHAMVETVGEHGYLGANVREVTNRAGVSRKTFYELFDSKDDCLFAIYDESARCLRTVVQHAYERGVTPQERLDAALSILIEWIDGEPDLARLCWLEVPTAGIAGRRRIAATMTWLTGVVADVLGDLDVPELLPELIVGGIQQMVVLRLVGDTAELPALADDLSEVWAYVEDAAR